MCQVRILLSFAACLLHVHSCLTAPDDTHLNCVLLTEDAITGCNAFIFFQEGVQNLQRE